MSNLTQYFPLSSTDAVAATLLSVSGVLGVPANILSCYCFWRTQVPRRTNTIYFKTAYMTITTIDALICLSQLPVIESLLTGRRGQFFSHNVGCKLWVILWRSLTMTSVFLVAQLSMSRLAVLAYPRLRIPFRYVLFPPAVFTIVMVAVSVTYLADFIQIEYFPTVTASCIFVGGRGGFNYTEAFLKPIPLPPSVLRADIISNILSSCSLGLPFVPIAISFILSIVYLNRAKNSRVNKGNKRASVHRYATNTIIFVTLMYLVWNIPTVIFLVIRIYRTVKLTEHNDSMTLHEVHRIINPTSIDKFYFRLVVEVGCVALNSALNPVIYLWRLRSFREVFFGTKSSGRRAVADSASGGGNIAVTFTPVGMTVHNASTLSSNAGSDVELVVMKESELMSDDPTGLLFINRDACAGYHSNKQELVLSPIVEEYHVKSEEIFRPPCEWRDPSVEQVIDTMRPADSYSPPTGWQDGSTGSFNMSPQEVEAIQAKIWDTFAACVASAAAETRARDDHDLHDGKRPVYFRTRKIKIRKSERSHSI